VTTTVESSRLREPERRALESLQATGIAILPFDELVADAGLWDDLAAQVEAFVGEVEDRAPRDVNRPMRKDDYLIRRFGGARALRDGKAATTLEPDDPWVRLGTCDPVLNVVNAYRGQWARLVDLDAWYTVPFAAGQERIASQRWHRDPEDHHVVKMFVYFSDVDEDAGPFEYVAGSAVRAPKIRHGLLGSLRLPWNRRRRYPPQEYMDKRIARAEVVTATGPTGTLILCDTSGLHRGGFARRTPRVLTTHTYVSPRAAAPRGFTVGGDVDGRLSEAGRFALS
jgi:hypothetical protein